MKIDWDSHLRLFPHFHQTRLEGSSICESPLRWLVQTCLEINRLVLRGWCALLLHLHMHSFPQNMLYRHRWYLFSFWSKQVLTRLISLLSIPITVISKKNNVVNPSHLKSFEHLKFLNRNLSDVYSYYF